MSRGCGAAVVTSSGKRTRRAGVPEARSSLEWRLPGSLDGEAEHLGEKTLPLPGPQVPHLSSLTSSSRSDLSTSITLWSREIPTEGPFSGLHPGKSRWWEGREQETYLFPPRPMSQLWVQSGEMVPGVPILQRRPSQPSLHSRSARRPPGSSQNTSLGPLP